MLPENSSLASEDAARQLCTTELKPQGVLDDAATTVSSRVAACQFQTSIKLGVDSFLTTVASTFYVAQVS